MSARAGVPIVIVIESPSSYGIITFPTDVERDLWFSSSTLPKPIFRGETYLPGEGAEVRRIFSAAEGGGPSDEDLALMLSKMLFLGSVESTSPPRAPEEDGKITPGREGRVDLTIEDGLVMVNAR